MNDRKSVAGMNHTPPPGDPANAFHEQERMLDEESRGSNTRATENSSPAPLSVPQMTAPNGSAPNSQRPVIGRVKLEFNSQGGDDESKFVLEFDVVAVGINDYTVGIALAANFNFVPKNMTDYLLTWQDESYPVQFLVSPVPLFDVPVIQFLRKR